MAVRRFFGPDEPPKQMGQRRNYYPEEEPVPEEEGTVWEEGVWEEEAWEEGVWAEAS